MNFWRRTNETDKNLLSLCIGASVLLASHTTLAQTFRAADVHPADYPNVVAVKHMGKNSVRRPTGVWRLKPFPVAY